MVIQFASFLVCSFYAAAYSSDTLRQCEMHSDCGTDYFCHTSYCEQCIPCKIWFNRQPALSLAGVPICARRDDDCGTCLPGYQAKDLSYQQRSMECFPLDETDPRNPFTVLLFAIMATAFMFILIVILTFLKRRRRQLEFQDKVLEPCATPPLYYERDPRTINESDRFIIVEPSETSICDVENRSNSDDPPTYEEAVNCLHRQLDLNTEECGTISNTQDADRQSAVQTAASSSQAQVKQCCSLHQPLCKTNFIRDWEDRDEIPPVKRNVK